MLIHSTTNIASRRWDSNPRVLSQAHYKCAPFDRFGTSASLILSARSGAEPRADGRNVARSPRITAGPHRGSVVEWLMAPGCKPGSRRRYAGSNPARPTMTSKRASPQGTRAAVSVPPTIERGRCIMVMPLPSKQESRVRFPPPAPSGKPSAVWLANFRPFSEQHHRDRKPLQSPQGAEPRPSIWPPPTRRSVGRGTLRESCPADQRIRRRASSSGLDWEHR